MKTSEERWFDDSGIPLMNVPYTNEYCHSPATVCFYGLGMVERYSISEQKGFEKEFLRQADWLVENIKVRSGGFGVWEHNYKVPWYNFKPPFLSALTQGNAISLLSKAYEITGKSRYIEIADLASRAFEMQIDDGGIGFLDEKGDLWLEEMAILPPPHILNGFVQALFCLHDFYDLAKDSGVLDLWEQGVKTLRGNIERYDTGYWSLYELCSDLPAPRNYHVSHIQQLGKLHELTGCDCFRNVHNRWKDYSVKPANHLRAKLRRLTVHLEDHGLMDGVQIYCRNLVWKERNKRFRREIKCLV
jgi:hypothetical protein